MSAKARAFQQACRARLVIPETKTSARTASINHVRSYAGQNNSTTSRRAITVTSDDGRYSWAELSTGEKAARTTQQTFNFVLVAGGAAATVSRRYLFWSLLHSETNVLFIFQCVVAYFLYEELFAPDSKTIQFNAAVSRVKASAECRELLGPSSKIVAYGEPTSNKWARARPLAHSSEVDRAGITHFRMHFNVEGPDNRGVVNVHMTKAPGQDRLEYRLLSLRVEGHPIVYLENKDGGNVKKNVGKMFGVQWR